MGHGTEKSTVLRVLRVQTCISTLLKFTLTDDVRKSLYRTLLTLSVRSAEGGLPKYGFLACVYRRRQDGIGENKTGYYGFFFNCASNSMWAVIYPALNSYMDIKTRNYVHFKFYNFTILLIVL